MHLPKIPGITAKTAKNLRWKSLKYLFQNDHNKIFRRHIYKHPFKYGFRLIKSYFQKKTYERDGDFFFYGVKNTNEFKKKISDSLLVVGFSYCHKPFQCPAGRFTERCIHDASHPVCQGCFIGKAVHSLPQKNAIPLFIPTIHYIGEKIFDILKQYPDKPLLFLITACELTLEMFGDFGNMVGISGIGVRLDGRICNTMKAFELPEEGIKPGLTVVLDDTKERILELLKTSAGDTVSGDRS